MVLDDEGGLCGLVQRSQQLVVVVPPYAGILLVNGSCVLALPCFQCCLGVAAQIGVGMLAGCSLPQLHIHSSGRIQTSLVALTRTLRLTHACLLQQHRE